MKSKTFKVEARGLLVPERRWTSRRKGRGAAPGRAIFVTRGHCRHATKRKLTILKPVEDKTHKAFPGADVGCG